MKGLTKLVMP